MSKLRQAPLLGCRFIASSVGSLRRNSIKILLNISFVRAKASTVVGLSLYSKLGRVTAPKLSQEATVDDYSEAHQRI